CRPRATARQQKSRIGEPIRIRANRLLSDVGSLVSVPMKIRLRGPIARESFFRIFAHVSVCPTMNLRVAVQERENTVAIMECRRKVNPAVTFCGGKRAH